MTIDADHAWCPEDLETGSSIFRARRLVFCIPDETLAEPRRRASNSLLENSRKIVVVDKSYDLIDKYAGAPQAGRADCFQTVSRRRTCDKRIWTQPLAFAADAEGYIRAADKRSDMNLIERTRNLSVTSGFDSHLGSQINCCN